MWVGGVVESRRTASFSSANAGECSHCQKGVLMQSIHIGSLGYRVPVVVLFLGLESRRGLWERGRMSKKKEVNMTSKHQRVSTYLFCIDDTGHMAWGTFFSGCWPERLGCAQCSKRIPDEAIKRACLCIRFRGRDRCFDRAIGFLLCTVANQGVRLLPDIMLVGKDRERERTTTTENRDGHGILILACGPPDHQLSFFLSISPFFFFSLFRRSR